MLVKVLWGGASLLDDTQWLTVEDIHELLGKRVPLDTIRPWIRSKRLPAYKPGRTYLVKKEDLEQFLRDSRTVDEKGP